MYAEPKNGVDCTLIRNVYNTLPSDVLFQFLDKIGRMLLFALGWRD